MRIIAHNANWIVVETVPATGTLDLVELEGGHPPNAMGFRCDRKTKTRSNAAYLFMVMPDESLIWNDSVTESAVELEAWPIEAEKPIKWKNEREFMDHGAV